ncbi:MAG: 4Fe-4S dicluster domain-containing protein [Chloroflexota bacterium]
MSETYTFNFMKEVSSLLHAADGNPFPMCVQCGTCSGTCPVAAYMDYTPRQIIAMVNAGLKEQVLESNTYWYCASCYHCTVRCPQNISITELMYALQRYSVWKSAYKEGLVGPAFSEAFAKMIVRTGRTFEPLLAPSYLFSFSMKQFIGEVFNATELLLKGRLPVLPPRIKRLTNFKHMIRRILPMGGLE